VSTDVSLPKKLYILFWWILVCVALTVGLGATFSGAFLALWLAARATAFHAITTLREMCDHYGLQPGGILSFTRDLVCHGFWRALIHPRNNGYHLTHHLLPAVPYYRLPQAQRLFSQVPVYHQHAVICRSYFTGAQAVIRAWQAAMTT
jgi:fatty acid desaturase